MVDQVQSVPQHRLDMGAVRDAFAQVGRQAAEIERSLVGMPRHRVTAELREFIDALLQQVRELQQRARNIVR